MTAAKSKFLTYRKSKQMHDREYLLGVLSHTQGNVRKAAKIARLNRTYVHKRIKELGLVYKYRASADAIRENTHEVMSRILQPAHLKRVRHKRLPLAQIGVTL